MKATVTFCILVIMLDRITEIHAYMLTSILIKGFIYSNNYVLIGVFSPDIYTLYQHESHVNHPW